MVLAHGDHELDKLQAECFRLFLRIVVKSKKSINVEKWENIGIYWKTWEVFFCFNGPHPLPDVENSSNFENSSFI